MKETKILFCTDFSRYSDAALPLATSLARAKNASMVVLHVQEPPTAYAAGELYYGPMEPDPDMLQQMLHRVKPDDCNVPFKHLMVYGNPAKEIARIADDECVEMIVMSTHGRTGLARMVLGSVAEMVIRRVHCPVVVFKEAEQESATESRNVKNHEHATS